MLSALNGAPEKYLTHSRMLPELLHVILAQPQWKSVMLELRSQGVIQGWRDELYPISNGFYQDPLFHMERATVPLVGAMEYGVHLNGPTRP